MKRAIALLLCILLVFVGALSVSAEPETTAATTVQDDADEGETYEYEVISKERSPYPRGAAMGMLLLGGVMILVAIFLLCIFLFAFPRWGLMKTVPSKKNETPADEEATITETPAEEVPLVQEAAEEMTDPSGSVIDTPFIAELLEEVAEETAEEETVETQEQTTVKLEDLF